MPYMSVSLVHSCVTRGLYHFVDYLMKCLGKNILGPHEGVFYLMHDNCLQGLTPT